MKQLKKWAGKEVIVTIRCAIKTYSYCGYIWRYVDWNYANGNVEYWIGYDGGVMERIYPKDVIEIKEIKQ